MCANRKLRNFLSNWRLSSPPSEKTTKPTRYYAIHALHDEANHQGEMWLLKKMQTKS